ncbi:MAG: uroporphyrinogen decarboxylase family protein [Candidatus Methanofastidiosia archaeon]
MIKRMTSAERVQAVMMGEKPDRVPVNPFILGYAAKIIGVPIGDLYSNGDICFDAQFASMRLHGYDVTPMYGYASCGPWEFGGELGFPYGPGHSAPYVIKHPVNAIEDVENLEVPDFDKELPGAYKIADRVAERCIALGMPATFQSGSTFTAASVVAETSLFLKWVHKEPKIMHLLLSKVSDMFVGALEYFANKYGAEKCMTFDGGPVESNTVLSPQMFEEFAYPYMEKLHMKTKELGFPAVLMHPCADQNLNIPYYVKLREKMNWQGRYIWLFGPETPIANQIKAFGDHDILCGNVDPPSLQTKSYEEVVMMCKENIEQGKDSPNGFILAPGCEFPPAAAPVKVMAMIDAAEKFGRYD